VSSAVPRPTQVPVRATVSEAWALLRGHPARLMLPLLVVAVGAPAVAEGARALAYLTIFADEPLLRPGDASSVASNPVLFVLFVAAALETLFWLVARGGTIVAVARIKSGKPVALAESLDPAFTRMGGIVAQGIMWSGVLGGLLLSLLGAVLLPYVGARLALGTEVLLLEGRSPVGAFASSWAMMRGRVIAWLGALSMALAACVVPAFVVVAALGFLVGGNREVEIVSTAVAAVLLAAALVPVIAFLTTVTTLFYLRAKEIDGGQRTA